MAEPDFAFPDVQTERRRTATACPTQYEGSLPDGRRYYFRYRSGRAVLGLGQTDEDAVMDAVDRLERGDHLRLGDRLDGELSEDQFECAAARLLRAREQMEDRDG